MVASGWPRFQWRHPLRLLVGVISGAGRSSQNLPFVEHDAAIKRSFELTFMFSADQTFIGLRLVNEVLAATKCPVS